MERKASHAAGTAPRRRGPLTGAPSPDRANILQEANLLLSLSTATFGCVPDFSIVIVFSPYTLERSKGTAADTVGTSRDQVTPISHGLLPPGVKTFDRRAGGQPFAELRRRRLSHGRARERRHLLIDCQWRDRSARDALVTSDRRTTTQDTRANLSNQPPVKARDVVCVQEPGVLPGVLSRRRLTPECP